MNRDLFLAILSMDTYNRGYNAGVKLPSGAVLIGNATITKDSSSLVSDGVRLDIPAGFYAIAYDLSNAGVAGLTGTVIAYRGTDSIGGLDGDLLNNFWGHNTRVRTH